MSGVLGLLAVRARKLGDELVLDQNEGLHRVLEGKLVFAHLREDSADVEVDVARVRDLETVVDSMLREVQVVVFDFKGLLKVRESRSQLLRPSEHASEIIVRNGTISIPLFGQRHGLMQQLQRNLEVL